MTKFFAALAVVFVVPFTSAQATPQDVVNAYADSVYNQYNAATADAIALKAAIEMMLANPSPEALEKVKQAWIKSRETYSPTEVFRFYSGPIDAEDGPEGALNAWPLDEAYIDYVAQDPNAGLIQKPDLYPVIDGDTLRAINEKDGEKNIATGYHAIEFMLWGQDLNDGSERRSIEDFTTKPFADRRAQYLRVVSDLLIQDLISVMDQWHPETGAYSKMFRDPAQLKQSLTNLIYGVKQMAGFELSQERMFVALDLHSQEDEHSCFSDNTHNDILYNFIGMKTVLQLGVVELIREKDAFVAAELEEIFTEAEEAILGIPAPFDEAILEGNLEGNAKVKRAIDALMSLAEAVEQGARTLGLELPAGE